MSFSERYRLPVEDPDFLYPTSKNPYSDRLNRFKGLVFSDQASESHFADWRAQMLDSSDHTETPRRELHVEIGCNAGHVIVEWATKNPQHCYVGIDWGFKPIFRAAEKAEKRELKNILFFRARAERLPFIFGPGEIDSLSLFFPDPWPKKAHWKHRFVTANTLKSLSKLLKKTGVFHIKTDHRGYFDWMLEAIKECPDHWEILESTYDLHRNHPNPQSLRIPDVTLFEKIFIKDKLPIHSVKLQPRL